MKERKHAFIIGTALIAVALILYGYSGLKSSHEQKVFRGTGFILEGHRGLSEKYPENTLVSFQAAAEQKQYQAIETDVQETSDGVLVLFHDRKLDKLTNGTGAVKDYTYEELSKLTIDNATGSDLYPGEKIPKLEEYLSICRQGGKIPYIELKSISRRGMEKLLRTLKGNQWEDSCVITTQVKEYVQEFRSLNSSYPLEYMAQEKSGYQILTTIAFLKQYPNMVFRPSAYQVRRRDVLFCRLAGIRVESYGLRAGDEKTLERLKRIGVRGVTCNDTAGLGE